MKNLRIAWIRTKHLPNTHSLRYPLGTISASDLLLQHEDMLMYVCKLLASAHKSKLSRPLKLVIRVNSEQNNNSLMMEPEYIPETLVFSFELTRLIA
jgi:hypothetical protein